MYRRSYRRFLKEPIPKKILNQLVNAANYIPSGGNDHRIDISILISEEKRSELLSAIYTYYKHIKKLLKNPFLRIIAKQLGDAKVKATLRDPFYFNKILNHIEKIGTDDDIVFYDAPLVFFFHTSRIMPTAKEDCVLSAYNVVLMSETLGLGSCFISLSQQAVTNNKKCKKILLIPQSHRVEAVVVIGYPERIYKRPVLRNSKPVYIL